MNVLDGKKFRELVQIQKICVLREYLTNINENFTVHTFKEAEQLYLVVERQFTLTKVL